MRLLHAIAGPPGRPGRERLRAAIASRDAAQHAVTQTRATLERLQTVVDQADDAAREAADATQLAKQGRERWVRDGCLANAREHQTLGDTAAEAVRAAERAALDANSVRGELARTLDVLRSAEFDLRGCEAEISSAVGAIIAAEAEPLFQRYAQIASEYRQLRFKLMALQRALDPGKYDDHQEAKSSEGARMVEEAMTRGVILPWDRERDNARGSDFVGGHAGRDDGALEDLVMRHRARALRLRADPES
jgi:hypothetical protein